MQRKNRPVGVIFLIGLGVVLASPVLGADDPCGKLASVQNDVTTLSSEDEQWHPSVINENLFASDRVKTGEGSRAAILYSDQTLHRVNEKSEVEIRAPQDGQPGALRVLSGQHYFSSRKPKDYGRIETPTVTAAIRGTEFVVDVGLDGTTTITMVEGVVDASNDFGSLRVSAGESAFVKPGSAPVRRVVVRPRDAVTWSLYYPRVVGRADAARLQSMGAEGQGLLQAADLLASGQVSRASSIIAEARERNPNNPVALALASVIEVVADRKDEARRLARKAYEADDESAAAAMAMSFSYQSDFDIESARELAETAVRLDPDSAEARARLAELRMAEGDTRGAREAAEKAVRRDADSSRALAVLGFVELAEFQTARAVETFRRAVASDPGFPLARLGLGIALLRSDLAAGREELQTAVILDPDNSLLRSYLSKAYFEERREGAASKELEIAKQLDPSDPTPHLYDAILKRTYNRPVEALGELQQSIKLNDQRAVYRSRLLLDEDLAVRSVDLAGIYNELGFDQLGMVTARDSADQDQSNFSSHLFLAGTYRNLPGFAPAFLSETLQARIYQPSNVNAVRPDVVNESVSFNEYTSLFNRPRTRGFAGLRYGSTDSDLSEYFDPGDVCLDPMGNVGSCLDLLEVKDSSSSGADLTLSFNRDRFAAAVSYQTFEDDGFRTNNDTDNDSVRAFMVFALTPRDQFQVNVIDGTRKTGDLPLRGFPALIGLERIETDLTNIGLGYHRKISPASDLAVSAIISEVKQDFAIPIFMQASSAEIDGAQLEAQYVLRTRNVSWTAGAGHYTGDQTVRSATFGLPPAMASGDDEFSNLYGYAKIRGMGP
ncbi:MAG: FecR domain-containing protein, partial [Acidobacteriota bacterium]|nr:FecR domain-containing protein [Acidobacteriota bacterium]